MKNAFIVLCSLLCLMFIIPPGSYAQVWLNHQDNVPIANVPSDVSLQDMIGVNIANGIQNIPANYSGVIKNARNFHQMDNDGIFEVNPSNLAKGKWLADGIPNPNTCDCTPNVFCNSPTNCEEMFNATSGKRGFAVKDWYCRWRNEEGFATTYAAFETIFPISATNCNSFVARNNRNYPNKFFTVGELGGSNLIANVEQYTINFLSTVCPTDLSKPCLVNVLEMGNEPWGSIPGTQGFLDFSQGVINGFISYYGTNPSTWRCKVSTAAVVASSITPGCNFDDHRQFIEDMVSPGNYSYIDYISLHNYAFPHDNVEVTNCLEISQNPESSQGMFLTLKNLIAWRDQNMPQAEVNITEFGWPANSTGNANGTINLGETRQNAYNMRAVLLANRYGINKTFYYNMGDTSEPQFSTSGLFVSGSSLTNPRETMDALLKLSNSTLSDKKFLLALEEDNNSSTGKYAYIFGDQNGNPTHLVVWKPEYYTDAGYGDPGTDSQHTSFTLPGEIEAETGATYFYLNKDNSLDDAIGSLGSSADVNGASSTVEVKLSGMPVAIPLTSNSCVINNQGQVINCDVINNCSGSTVSDCNVTVDVSGQTVSFVSTSETDILIIKVRKADWSEQYDLCNGYNPATACGSSSSVTVTGTGTYVVDIQGGTSCSTFDITVPGGGGGGTDNDNDGICSDEDCDDNDAAVGASQPVGTACDDGDSSTTDDEIQADGCTCLGTPTGCGSFTDNDNDGICSNEDCDDNNASVGASQPQYTPCDDGNANTSYDMIQADGCTCLGVNCGGGGSTVSGCNVTVDVSGQTVSFVSTSETDILIIKVRKADWSEQYDLCNDYNPATACGPSSSVTVTGTGTYVVDIQGGTSCSTFNITVPGGGGSGTDNDNDSVCDVIDCDDSDASIGAPQPAGTSCDDGDSSTTDDEIQADGCTCLGTPIGCGSFTDNDNDGICSNEDCDDNNASVGASQPQYTPCNDGNSNTDFDMIQADGCTCLGVSCDGGGSTVSGCNVTVDVSGQTVSFVSTSETDILIIKVRKADWSEQYDLCNDYNPATACSPSSSVTVTGTGTYVVDIQGGTSCSTFNITVPGGGSTDNDNDSVCDVIDCDDNDASVGVPQPAGTVCDDGNPSTTNDEIQADGCTCLGSNNLTVNTDRELEQGRLSVFPNPTSGVIQLLVPHANSIHQVEVYNINGERILQLREQPTRVDLSAQPNGVYWLRVSTEKGVINRRIIKQ